MELMKSLSNVVVGLVLVVIVLGWSVSGCSKKAAGPTSSGSPEVETMGQSHPSSGGSTHPEQPVEQRATRGNPGSDSLDVQRIDQAIGRMEQLGLGHLAVSAKDGALLEETVRSTRAKHVVEVGTSTGYSSLWICRGLAETGGRLSTFEIDPGRAKLALEIFKEAGCDRIITLVVGDAHKEVASVEGVIDVVFLDADKDGYLDYLKQLLPRVRKNGIIAAHNMKFPPPDPRYMQAVTTDPNLETKFENMDGAGMGITRKIGPK